MTYEEQLKDPRWLELREKIINRDWIRDIMLEMIDGWQKIIRNGKEI